MGRIGGICPHPNLPLREKGLSSPAAGFSLKGEGTFEIETKS